jgi:hypothetical protein
MNNRLMCLVIVAAVLGLGKWMGWFGFAEEKMTPVEAASEPLVSEMPVGRLFPETPGSLIPDFSDRDRLDRNSDAAMDEIEAVTRQANSIGDDRTIDALRPLVERFGAAMKRIQDGNYEPESMDQEISAIRRELRRMGLVRDRKQ